MLTFLVQIGGGGGKDKWIYKGTCKIGDSIRFKVSCIETSTTQVHKP